MRVRLITAGLVCGVLGAGAATFAIAAEDEPASGAQARVETSIAQWRWAPSEDALPRRDERPGRRRRAARHRRQARPCPRRRAAQTEGRQARGGAPATQADRSEPESSSDAP
jgi:hypothetical protein